MGEVDVCRALRLGEGEVEEEHHLEGVIEGDPVTMIVKRSQTYYCSS